MNSPETIQQKSCMLRRAIKVAAGVLLIGFMSVLFGCAARHAVFPLPEGKVLVYRAANGEPSDAARYAPVLIIQEPEKSYNRIGSPAARYNEDRSEEIYVNPDNPAYFVQKAGFRSGSGEYVNYVYRVHFERTPRGFTAGRNVGLIFVVTVNSRAQPVLFTSVHTCGCYLSIIPTSYLSADAYPAGWRTEGQTKYGEYLPGILRYQEAYAEAMRMVVLIAGGTHRVKGVWLKDRDDIDRTFMPVQISMRPMEELNRLPFDGGTTSFFETEGPHRGYVKGSYKPYEKLLMSWWAFDLKVGDDKAYDPGGETGAIFYTSLKFWARDSSDMRNFGNFLKYWGWNL